MLVCGTRSYRGFGLKKRDRSLDSFQIEDCGLQIEVIAQAIIAFGLLYKVSFKQ